MRSRGGIAMKVIVAALGLVTVILVAVPSRAATSIGQPTPPTTDFHTVVTEPGGGGGGGGAGGSDDEPHRPVCLWERGGSVEIDTVARNSGTAAAIIREDAADHILL